MELRPLKKYGPGSRNINWKKSVIIAITANHIEKKVKELLAKGFDAIITKPFVPNDIREVLTKHFQF